MPGSETGGVSNFWYSFDYGLAHFVSIDTETDFAKSPEYPFVAELKGNETFPKEHETYVTDSGPFGYINGSYTNNKVYEQYNWLAADLAAVNRTATPWVIAMGHRPMYSSQVSSYQANIRNAFEALMLQNGVDAYFAGHIHWYERLFPLGANGTINAAAIVNNNTYMTDAGKSIAHIVNGMAGNIESHSTLSATAKVLNITAVLNNRDYGFSKMTFFNSSVATWQFIKGADGSVGDTLTLIKKSTATTSTSASKSATSASSASTKPATFTTSASSSAKSATFASASSVKASTASAATSSVGTQTTIVVTSSTKAAASSEASSAQYGHGKPTEHGPPHWHSEGPRQTEHLDGPGFWSGWDKPGAWSGYEHGPEETGAPGQARDW